MKGINICGYIFSEKVIVTVMQIEPPKTPDGQSGEHGGPDVLYTNTITYWCRDPENSMASPLPNP